MAESYGKCSTFQETAKPLSFLKNSGLHAYKAGALQIELCLQPMLLCLFWRWGLMNYFPGLALNYNPPDFSLPSS
jgi:hypothetical protein